MECPEDTVAGTTVLEALEAYIKQERDTKPFQDPDSPLRQFVLKSADRIAIGALTRHHDVATNDLLQGGNPLVAATAKVILLESLISNPARTSWRERRPMSW